MKLYYSSAFALILLFISMIIAPQASAQEVPASIYNQYQTLASTWVKIKSKKESESKKVLIEKITTFYQKQSTHSIERQLLASNLYLQVLLTQEEYEQSYRVVDKLLKQKLNQQQQLTFEQLAGQLAAQFKNSNDKNIAWALVEKHYVKWFSLLKQIDDKQRNSYKITNKQEASNAALLAQAFYFQDKLKTALTPAKRAYNLFSTEKPYLNLILVLLQGLERHQELNQYLQVAVKNFSQSEDYWHRLAYNYLSLNKNKQALSTLAITRNHGLLNSQGYKVLSSLYLQQHQPRLAVDVYKEGTERKLLVKDKNYYEIILNAWLIARDRKKALHILKEAKKAGYLSNQQEQQQAQLFYLEGNWTKAESAYKSLLKNTGLKSTQLPPKQENKNKLTKDKWRFLLAMSQIEQNKKEQAKVNLLKLQTKQYKNYAEDWLKQIE